MLDTLLTPVELLRHWLATQLTPSAWEWLEDRLQLMVAGDQRALFLNFGMTSRKTGKADLKLLPADLAAADRVKAGWQPNNWSLDQAARSLLLLSYPADPVASYVATLDKLFAAAEVGELVALYQTLPLLPHPKAHIPRCAEGLRTNVKSVFTAIAHRNPYPAEYLSEAAWNQMVLKCLFVGATLAPVVALDERANPTLAQMLLDYAHERRAAGRAISVELWRAMGPYAPETAISDLQQLLTSPSPSQRQAAALTLSLSPLPSASAALANCDLLPQIESGQLTWYLVTSAAEAENANEG